MIRQKRGGHYAGVVLDLDGVLTDTEHLWEENWIAYCEQRGQHWGADNTAAVQGMSVPEWSRYIAQVVNNGDQAEEIGDAVIDGMIRALEEGRVELAPGAPELVEAVAERVPLALASSAPRRLIEAVLTTTGLIQHFGATVSSEEVARGKPSPDVYEEAARRLEVEPVQCLGVEDSSNGILAAVAAGLTVIAIPNRLYPPRSEALALCAMVASSLADVRAGLIDRLDGRPIGGGRA